jgi:ribonuclease Z
MARLILLGVGTAVPDADRGHTHMVWDGPGGPLLIDAGGSTYQRLLRAGIDPLSLEGVVLTHSHADHLNDLPTLLFSLSLAGLRQPLPIYGLEPTLRHAHTILDAFDLGDHVAPVVWIPLEAGDTIALKDTWVLRTAPTHHSRPCLALRFETPTTALTYSGDTAPCQEVVNLARGAAVLVHEATTPTPSEHHTTPRQAGDIAARAGVNRLILVHFSPQWTMPEPRALAEIHASGFSGSAEIGHEYQEIKIG